MKRVSCGIATLGVVLLLGSPATTQSQAGGRPAGAGHDQPAGLAEGHPARAGHADHDRVQRVARRPVQLLSRAGRTGRAYRLRIRREAGEARRTPDDPPQGLDQRDDAGGGGQARRGRTYGGCGCSRGAGACPLPLVPSRPSHPEAARRRRHRGGGQRGSLSPAWRSTWSFGPSTTAARNTTSARPAWSRSRSGR